MPLKIYRDKKSRNATIFITIDGKSKAINFIGGVISISSNTGCYVTDDKKIQDALESRVDFSKEKYDGKGNFYVESVIETDVEIAEKEKSEKEKSNQNKDYIFVPNPEAETNPIVAEFESQLNDMVKEAFKIPVVEENTEVETILTEATEQTTTETTEKAAEDLSHITNYQAAKSYLMKNCGATPDDVKNKESLLAYCEKNQINLPNFK